MIEAESFDEILSKYLNQKFGQGGSFWEREIGTYQNQIQRRVVSSGQ